MKRIRSLTLLAFLLVGLISASVAAVSAKEHKSQGKSTGPEATITVQWDEDCKGFTVESDKDISHVEKHFQDGTVEKNENIKSTTYTFRGDKVITHIFVKSGRTLERFDCSTEPPEDTVDALDIDPDHEVNEPGDDHTVTLTASKDNQPVAGVDIRFQIVRNADHQNLHTDIVLTTGQDGTVTHTWSDGADGDDDAIYACTNPDGTAPDTCLDNDGNLITEGRVTAEATKEWREIEDGLSLTLSQEKDTNDLGEEHEVTATVTDSDGPVVGAGVRFEVWREGSLHTFGTDTTNDDGEATFSYTENDEEVTDTIIACTTGDPTPPSECSTDGSTLVSGVAGDKVNKTWVEPPPPAGRWTCRASALRTEGGLLGDLLGDENGVIEPVTANADEEECTNDDDSVLDESLSDPLDMLGALDIKVLYAETSTNNDANATAGVAEVVISSVSEGEILRATVIESTATGTCDEGSPKLESSSTIASLSIMGADPLVDVTNSQTIEIPGVATLHINWENFDDEDDPTEVTRRAIFLELEDPFSELVESVIVAEAIADVHGNPCA